MTWFVNGLRRRRAHVHAILLCCEHYDVTGNLWSIKQACSASVRRHRVQRLYEDTKVFLLLLLPRVIARSHCPVLICGKPISCAQGLFPNIANNRQKHDRPSGSTNRIRHDRYCPRPTQTGSSGMLSSPALYRRFPRTCRWPTQEFGYALHVCNRRLMIRVRLLPYRRQPSAHNMEPGPRQERCRDLHIGRILATGCPLETHPDRKN